MTSLELPCPRRPRVVRHPYSSSANASRRLSTTRMGAAVLSILLVVPTSLLLGATQSSAASVACQKSNRKLVIRENRCKNKEKRIRIRKVTGPPANVVEVSADAEALENGTSLLAALAEIEDASADKPYLLKLGPGEYDLDGDSLVMKPFVDVEGSGQGITVVTSRNSSPNLTGRGGTLRGASDSEVRLLAVENTSGATSFDAAIVAAFVSNFSLLHVSAFSAPTSGSSNTYGVAILSASVAMKDVSVSAADNNENVGVVISGTSSVASMSNVEIDTSGGSYATGVRIADSGATVTMTDVTATAAGASSSNHGVAIIGNTTGSTVVIERSAISGTTNAITNLASGATVIRVGASRIDGAVGNAGGGTLTCVGAYDAAFAALDTSCQ